MYHLTQFDIHQFRGFRNLHLEQLGRVNLLVGMNNSGKTSVLEALSLYCCSTDVTEWLSTVYRRRAPRSFGPFKPSPAMIEALKWLFPREPSNSHGNIKMTAQGSFQVREVQATLLELTTSEVQIDSKAKTDWETSRDRSLRQGVEIQVQQCYTSSLPNLTTSSASEKWVLWEHEKFFTRPNRQRLGHVLPLANVTPFSLRAERPILHQLTHAKLSGTVDLVLQLLQKIDPGVETLEILYSLGSPSLYLQHRETGFAPVGIFGDGLQRSLAMALSALSVPNGILLIDEIEAGLHTSILKDVFAWLVKTCQTYNTQLFITTHSLEPIDAILALFPKGTEDIVAYRFPGPGSNQPLKRVRGDLLYYLRYECGLEVR